MILNPARRPVLDVAHNKNLPEASRAGVESGLFQGAYPQSLFQVCDLQKIFRTQPVIFKLLPLMAPEPL